MMQLIKDKFYEVIKAIAPYRVVCILQFTLVHAPVVSFLQFLIGSAMATVGMVMFFMGIDIGILPMGRIIGSDARARCRNHCNSLCDWFATTIAEPDVLVLSSQVDALRRAHSEKCCIICGCGGSGYVCRLSNARIVYDSKWFTCWLQAIQSSFFYPFPPAGFIPLAYDAGSVTTGVLTAPVVIALALGLSSVLAGRSALSDGFGLLGFASIGPIITIMIMGILWSWVIFIF